MLSDSLDDNNTGCILLENKLKDFSFSADYSFFELLCDTIGFDTPNFRSPPVPPTEGPSLLLPSAGGGLFSQHVQRFWKVNSYRRNVISVRSEWLAHWGCTQLPYPAHRREGDTVGATSEKALKTTVQASSEVALSSPVFKGSASKSQVENSFVWSWLHMHYMEELILFQPAVYPKVFI